jgi:fucose permease
MEPLRASQVLSVTVSALSGESRVRPDLSGRRNRRAPDLRRLRRPAEARLTMLMILLYAAGGVAIAVYMVAALLRPEKF